MPLFFWDASALIKRYFVEEGSDAVDALFDNVPLSDMVTTPWGYAETYSILVRRLNEKVLDVPSFNTATTSLQSEVVDSPDFSFLPISDATVFASIVITRKHNLNATDSAILTTLLDYIKSSGASSVLVAADKRLIRAADGEGLKTLNPQLLVASDIPAILAAL